MLEEIATWTGDYTNRRIRQGERMNDLDSQYSAPSRPHLKGVIKVEPRGLLEDEPYETRLEDE